MAAGGRPAAAAGQERAATPATPGGRSRSGRCRLSPRSCSRSVEPQRSGSGAYSRRRTAAATGAPSVPAPRARHVRKRGRVQTHAHINTMRGFAANVHQVRRALPRAALAGPPGKSGNECWLCRRSRPTGGPPGSRCRACQLRNAGCQADRGQRTARKRPTRLPACPATGPAAVAAVLASGPARRGRGEDPAPGARRASRAKPRGTMAAAASGVRRSGRAARVAKPSTVAQPGYRREQASLRRAFVQARRMQGKGRGGVTKHTHKRQPARCASQAPVAAISQAPVAAISRERGGRAKLKDRHTARTAALPPGGRA